MKKYIFLGMVLLLPVVLASCGSTNKRNTDSFEYNQMVEKVRSLEFTIENEWADPLQYSRVNLLGNPNYIRFEKDSVDVFLPFFGERQIGGGYGTNGAIEYEGSLQDLQIEEGDDKNQINLSFEGNNKGENLNFRLTIYPNGNTRTSVTSSQRDQIDYEGKIIKSE